MPLCKCNAVNVLYTKLISRVIFFLIKIFDIVIFEIIKLSSNKAAFTLTNRI